MPSAKILGHAYAFHILDDVSGKELTFTRLLRDLSISRGALATTLNDLVAGKLVHRRRYGRHVYYSITEKGLKLLRKYSVSPDFLEDRVLQAVCSRLAARFPARGDGFSKRQIAEKVRPRIRQFMDVLASDLMTEVEGGIVKRPSTKAEMFGSGELPAELEHVADASTVELLRREVKQIRTLRELSNPHVRPSEVSSPVRDMVYMSCKTTRIFCRLTCPCKMPKIENLRFFRSAEEASASGYRPCKICKPL